MIRYAALRLSLLVVVGALLYLAGMRGALLAGAAIVIAALLAYILFPSERNQAAKKLEAIAHREEKPREPDSDMEAEDAMVDEDAPESFGGPASPNDSANPNGSEDPGEE